MNMVSLLVLLVDGSRLSIARAFILFKIMGNGDASGTSFFSSFFRTLLVLILEVFHRRRLLWYRVVAKENLFLPSRQDHLPLATILINPPVFKNFFKSGSSTSNENIDKESMSAFAPYIPFHQSFHFHCVLSTLTRDFVSRVCRGSSRVSLPSIPACFNFKLQLGRLDGRWQ